MKDRRILTYALDQAHAERRHAYYYERDNTARIEQVNGQWAVTAAKVTKRQDA